VTNGLLALLLGFALQFASGALAGLRPVVLTRETPAPAAVMANSLAGHSQSEEPDSGTVNVTAVAGGGPFGFCLGTDPQALRQAAAEALNLTPESLSEALAGGRTLAQIAEDHGVSRNEMEAALRGAAQASLRAELDPLVAAGELTQEQAEALLALQAAQDLSHLLDLGFFFALPGAVELAPGDWPEFGPGFSGRPPFADELMPARRGGFALRLQFESGGEPFAFELSDGSPEIRAALAQALGLSEADLTARLDTGETLSEIAEAQGMDKEALGTAWREAGLAKARVELEAAVAEGRLTQAQADEILAEIEQALSGSRMFPAAELVFGGEGRWPFIFPQEDIAKPTD
jgi:hypothetical protein